MYVAQNDTKICRRIVNTTLSMKTLLWSTYFLDPLPSMVKPCSSYQIWNVGYICFFIKASLLFQEESLAHKSDLVSNICVALYLLSPQSMRCICICTFICICVALYLLSLQSTRYLKGWLWSTLSPISVASLDFALASASSPSLSSSTGSPLFSVTTSRQPHNLNKLWSSKTIGRDRGGLCSKSLLKGHLFFSDPPFVWDQNTNTYLHLHVCVQNEMVSCINWGGLDAVAQCTAVGECEKTLVSLAFASGLGNLVWWKGVSASPTFCQSQAKQVHSCVMVQCDQGRRGRRWAKRC